MPAVCAAATLVASGLRRGLASRSEGASYRREGGLAIGSLKCQGNCHEQLWHFAAGSCDAALSLY
jgi:hypothetical protein